MSEKNPSYLTSPLLTEAGVTHGFFTRLGGHSKPPFASLNLSEQVGDSADAVQKNRRVVASHLGISEQHLYYPRQVHGVECLLVDPSIDHEFFETQSADSVLTQTRGVAAAVRTADCVPILIADRESSWVAAVHAGWRGCEQNAVAYAVRALREKGASQLIAAIGPHISLDAFEVDENTAEQLLNSSPDPTIVERHRVKPHVDLRKMVRAQLNELSLRPEDIDDVIGCTVQDEEHFFSFRRDGDQSGRQLSAIVPPERTS